MKRSHSGEDITRQKTAVIADNTTASDDSSADNVRGAKERITRLTDIIKTLNNGPIVSAGLFVSCLMDVPSEHGLVVDKYRYRMADRQVTLPISDSVCATCKSAFGISGEPCISDCEIYTDVLTVEGGILLTNTLHRALVGQYDCTLDYYCGYYIESGPYIPDQKSDFYCADDFIGLTSRENLCIRGVSGTDPVVTGEIIMYGSTWALSRSRVLYRLLVKMPVQYFADHFDQ